MGLGLTPTDREKCFSAGKAASKSRAGKKGRPEIHAKKPTTQAQVLANVKLPKTDLHAFVDVNAIGRSKAVAGVSMMTIARNTLSVPRTGKPKNISLFFDLADRSRYPPQRADVHNQRAVDMPYHRVHAMLKAFGKTELSDLETIDVTHLPLLTSDAVPWLDAFLVPECKALAWRALAEAIRVCAVNDDSGTAYAIHTADGVTRHAVVGGKCTTTVAASSSQFGEADLSVMQAATVANQKGENVIVHTIDTDYLAMGVCAAWHTPPSKAVFLIALKSAVYNVASLVRCVLGDKSECDRLNAGFWMFGMGGDYVNPLTNNGYYRKGLVPFIKEERTGPFEEREGKVFFVLANAVNALRKLPRRIQKKRVPKKTLECTLMDMYFCVMYYGRYFDPSKLAAPALLAPSKHAISLPANILQ